MSMVQKTPPRLPASFFQSESAETPGPSRARINNLQNQVSELVRKNQGLERKLTAETSTLRTSLKEATDELKVANRSLGAAQKELERCVAEGSGMREELELHSIIQQQKALLALAEEQMHVVELEARLVESERAQILRDHKIALFKAREEDLLADLEEKDIHIEDLESSLSKTATVLERERTSTQSSSSKQLRQVQSELASARAEIENLNDKTTSLESKVRALKEREKEARAELESWLRDEGSTSKQQEKKEMNAQMRALKSELERTREELDEAREDLKDEKKGAKEKEKVLKMKLKETTAEKERLLEAEEESVEMKAKSSGRASPLKSRKVRKTSPVTEESEEEAVPKKKIKKAPKAASPVKVKSKIKKADTNDSASEPDEPAPPVTKSKAPARSPVKAKAKPSPLEESDADNKAPVSRPKSSKAKTAEPEAGDHDGDEPKAAPIGDKKKKRRILGAQAAPSFSWDPVLNSGDGVIPSYLSPVKPAGVKATGTIPRAGFTSVPSRLGRLG